MGRPRRISTAGAVYHALNRATARATIFHDEGDYAAFVRVLCESVARHQTRLLAYCILPNHFHLILSPDADGDLSRFMGWLSLTHVQRWHAHHRSTGTGPLYQGRFKSFPVQCDDHFLTVCRYVERNALRAGLVGRAEDWPWGSLWHATSAGGECDLPTLSAWPVSRPGDWVERVNAAFTAGEEDALRRCIRRGQPFGSETWAAQTAQRLGMLSTMRSSGRPRKGAPLRSQRLLFPPGDS